MLQNPEKRPSAQGKRQLYRDENRDRLTQAGTGNESPLPGGFHGFLIESKRRVEGANHLNIGHVAVRPHDTLEQYGALHFRAHGVRCVLRLYLSEHLRKRHATAGAARRRWWRGWTWRRIDGPRQNLLGRGHVFGGNVQLLLHWSRFDLNL